MNKPFDRNWLLLSAVCLVLVVVVLNTNRGRLFGTTETSPPTHTLSAPLAAQLFDRAPTLETEGNVQILALFCRGAESTECYFMPARRVPTYSFADDPEIESDANRIPPGLAGDILRGLDKTHLRRARNQTIILHCRREPPGLLSCTANGGEEAWYPVPVT